MINTNHSSTVCAILNDSISNMTDKMESCLKADSYFQASRTPFKEFFDAARILVIPVSPGFNLESSVDRFVQDLS